MERDIIQPLKVLPFGVCHECLTNAYIEPLSSESDFIHYHCINKDCKLFMKDQIISKEIFNLLHYLEFHQPPN